MGELNNVDLKVVLSQQSKHTLFVGELINADLDVVPISAKQAYMVCERAKQCRLKSGSYLSRASISVLWES